jgi:tetratricopeptide (TPR) repeat protein
MARDSQGQSLSSAIISLQSKDGKQNFNTETDLQGKFCFSGLLPDIYILHAGKAGFDDVTLPPLVLTEKQAKTIELTMVPKKAGEAAAGSSVRSETTKPEFFDEPQFTVAGVSDTTNLGGHGSNVSVRNQAALAKETVELGKPSSPADNLPPESVAKEQLLRAAVEHDPKNSATNYQLGKLLINTGRSQDAVPYLEHAAQLEPADYNINYELALASANSGNAQQASKLLQSLLAHQDNPELHHLLGEVDEQLGDPLSAVREYQRAAEMSATEINLFDWGTDLLLHNAAEPAVEIFTKGNRLFPTSVRILVGLGVAWYARGSYDQAVQYLCQASDLNPQDLSPYMFLGKMQIVEAAAPKESGEKLARFAELHPENALANYYYAMSLWKQRSDTENSRSTASIESLLQKAVQADPKLAVAYLQLGVLYAEHNDMPKAISSYQKAIEADPNLEQAHYRLAQAYRQIGETAKAKAEAQTYQEISKQTAEQSAREGSEIKQFIYTLRGKHDSSPQ